MRKGTEHITTNIQTQDLSKAVRCWSLPSSCSVIFQRKLWTVTDAIFFIARSMEGFARCPLRACEHAVRRSYQIFAFRSTHFNNLEIKAHHLYS
jgi:hypothetical protein